MTRFEKDLRDALAGAEREIIMERRKKIKALEKELGYCKNGFRAQCIFQDLTKQRNELAKIEQEVFG